VEKKEDQDSVVSIIEMTFGFDLKLGIIFLMGYKFFVVHMHVHSGLSLFA